MYNYHNRISTNSFQQPQPLQNSTRNQPNNFRQTNASKNMESKKVESYQQKIKTLGRVRYLNQLAQLEYEQKLTQLHTKYSSKTKQSVQKKLRARNQIAEFIEEEEEQFGQEFEELMDYKYGASKWKNFHFEQDNTNKDYSFCSLCDQIHKMAESEHANSCRYYEYSKSPLYYFESLDRIKNSLTRLTSQQAQQLSNLASRIRKSQNVQRELLQIMPMLRNDEVLSKIAAKLNQILQQTQ